MVDMVSKYIVVYSLLDCYFPHLQLCQRADSHPAGRDIKGITYIKEN